MNAMLSLRLGDTLTSRQQCQAMIDIAADSIQTNIANASYLSATEQWEKAIPFLHKNTRQRSVIPLLWSKSSMLSYAWSTKRCLRRYYNRT